MDLIKILRFGSVRHKPKQGRVLGTGSEELSGIAGFPEET